MYSILTRSTSLEQMTSPIGCNKCASNNFYQNLCKMLDMDLIYAGLGDTVWRTLYVLRFRLFLCTTMDSHDWWCHMSSILSRNSLRIRYYAFLSEFGCLIGGERIILVIAMMVIFWHITTWTSVKVKDGASISCLCWGETLKLQSIRKSSYDVSGKLNDRAFLTHCSWLLSPCWDWHCEA